MLFWLLAIPATEGGYGMSIGRVQPFPPLATAYYCSRLSITRFTTAADKCHITSHGNYISVRRGICRWVYQFCLRSTLHSSGYSTNWYARQTLKFYRRFNFTFVREFISFEYSKDTNTLNSTSIQPST